MRNPVFLMNKRRQQGAVLVIALVILFVMTLMGLVAIQVTSLDEKIAGNLRDWNAAMQSAESALREAEAFIENLSNTTNFGVSPGLYARGTAPSPYVSNTWQTGQSILAATHLGVAKQPRYFIEYIDYYGGTLIGVNVVNYGSGSIGPIGVFRIVARGTGLSGTASVILEVFYGKSF